MIASIVFILAGDRIFASENALAVFAPLLWSESRPELMLCNLLTLILLCSGRKVAYRVLGRVNVAVLTEKLAAVVPSLSFILSFESGIGLN